MDSTHQTAEVRRLKDFPAPQRRVIRAWCMYDWANSAFATSGVAAIFPVYFVFLFKESFGESATILGITFTGSSTWGLGVAVSTAIVALTSPVLGIISDRIPIKKTLLWIYTIIGSVFTVLVFFSVYTSQPWAWVFGMFVLANVGLPEAWSSTTRSCHTSVPRGSWTTSAAADSRMATRWGSAPVDPPRADPGDPGHSLRRPSHSHRHIVPSASGGSDGQYGRCVCCRSHRYSGVYSG